MKKQQKNISHSVALLTVLLTTSTTTMARSTPVTVQNDASNPVPVELVSDTNTPKSSYQAVGISTTEVKGNEGVITLNSACNTEFPGSRMCTTDEIMQSNEPLPRRSRAWVNPMTQTTQVLVMPDGTLKTIVSEKNLGTVLHVNGNFLASINCRGFSNHGGPTTGIVVSDNGRFDRGLDCNVARPVACCAAISE